MACGPITSWQMAGKTVEIMIAFIFLDLKITADGDCSHKTKRCLLLGRKAVKSRQCIKKQRHYFANKGPSSQSYGFSSSHVWMWELDYKESWALKNWCFWTVVLEKTLESPLDFKEIKPVHPKGNQSRIFVGRTPAEAETQYFVHLMQRAGTLEKTLLGKIEGRRRRGWQNEMVRWHHWLNGHEFEQAPGDGEGQGSLACCSPWGHKESDTSEWLHNNNNWEKYKPQGTTLKQVWYFLGFLYIVESHVQLGTIEKTRLFTCSKWEHMNGSV